MHGVIIHNTSGFYLQNYHNTVLVMYIHRLMKGSVASTSRKKRNAEVYTFDKSMSATSAKMARVDKDKTDTACTTPTVSLLCT